MKWSWKIFGLQLGVILIAGIGIGYCISLGIDARRGSGAPDSTLISLAFGGFIAPLILALVAGWKGWILKSPLIVSFVVSGLYASNLVFGILCVIVSIALYFLIRKLRQVLAFYMAPTSSEDLPDDDSTITKNPNKAWESDADEAV